VDEKGEDGENGENGDNVTNIILKHKYSSQCNFFPFSCQMVKDLAILFSFLVVVHRSSCNTAS
jgi:hypothetical protein